MLTGFPAAAANCRWVAVIPKINRQADKLHGPQWLGSCNSHNGAKRRFFLDLGMIWLQNAFYILNFLFSEQNQPNPMDNSPSGFVRKRSVFFQNMELKENISLSFQPDPMGLRCQEPSPKRVFFGDRLADQNLNSLLRKNLRKFLPPNIPWKGGNGRTNDSLGMLIIYNVNHICQHKLVLRAILQDGSEGKRVFSCEGINLDGRN